MRAVIVGSGGQDGRILAEQLGRSGHEVIGITRAGSLDILDPGAVRRFVGELRPEEIYYLAAYHHSSQEVAPPGDELMRRSLDAHVVGLTNVLEAVAAEAAPGSRLLYAASSHVFGDPKVSPQNEGTPFEPTCVYGITKLAGLQTCRLYRAARGVRASVAILFNHESRYRRPEFVSQKIVRAAVAIGAGRESSVTLGDLDAQIDWGYAPDYCEAMQLIIRQPEAGEFVVATGEPHTVREFAEEAFRQVGLNFRDYVKVDPRLISKARRTFVGDAGKLRRATGWQPTASFSEMVALLVAAAREGNDRIV